MWASYFVSTGAPWPGGIVTGMRSRAVTTWGEFDSLARCWESVHAASPEHTIFTTWDWVYTWSQIWRDRIEPFVVVCEEAGEVVAIAPLYRSGARLLGLMNLDVLRMLGDFGSSGEYLDFLAVAEVAVPAKRNMLEFLESQRDSWDILLAPQLPEWKGLTTLTALQEVEGLTHRKRPRKFASISLPSENKAVISRNLRSNLKRFENHIKGDGFEVLQCRDREELPLYLEQLFSLHNKRWQSVGQVGTFAKNLRLTQFYEAFASLALDNNWLRIFRLEVAGVTRAIQFGYRYGDVFYVIQEGFDPEHYKGVGNILRAHVIRHCIDEGVREYDFMAGLSQHKQRWDSRSRGGCDLIVFNGNLRSFGLRSGGWPGGRLLQLQTYDDN